MDDESGEFTLPTIPCDEPSLPVAPPFTGSYSNVKSRKRPFLRSREPSAYEDQLADAINTSSDPALFSNDETPDAENYSVGVKRRKKKTYEGTWWGDELQKTRVRHLEKTHDTVSKRHFRRNFDSGIFMADESSGTDLSSEDLLEQELLDAQERDATEKAEQATRGVQGGLPRTKSGMHRTFKVATEAALKRMPQSRPINPKDHLIRKVVQDCLTTNNENVDWTGMRLDYLPPAITDLKSLIKRINSEAISDKLAPFEAQLRVFLGNNEFSQLPQPLLELTNIQLLSLRQNNLSEIPPGIQSLANLEELNIASNNLRYLPSELLHLVQHKRLRTIHDSPNPWMPVPAMDDRFCDAPVTWLGLPDKRLLLHRSVVSKPVEFLPDGTVKVYANNAPAISKQPHLTEMVLRALSRHNASKADLSSYLSEEHPEPVRKLLLTLHAAQISGGRSCTFCKRNIVQPRYLWYEWWDFSPDPDRRWLSEAFTSDHDNVERRERANSPGYERLLPFQQMACGCVDVSTGMLNELRELKRLSGPPNHPWLLEHNASASV